jgi:hypothetical protein
MQDIPLLLDCMEHFISNTIGPTDLLRPSPVPHFKIYWIFVIFCPQCPNFSATQKFCSKCSTLLVSSFNLSPICKCKKSSYWTLICHDSAAFNFSCTSYIICYHAAKIVEMFHILQLFLIYHNLYWGWLLWDSHHLSFFHTHLDLIVWKMLHLEYSIVWCWNLDTSESRSEISEKFWNVVLEKDGENQLDQTCEKWIGVIRSQGEKEDSANRRKEA